MIGMRNRGQLPPVIEDEFEALIGKLKEYLLKQHNDDGTHKGITFSGPVTKLTIVNGIVTAAS